MNQTSSNQKNDRAGVKGRGNEGASTADGANQVFLTWPASVISLIRPEMAAF